MLDDLKFIHEKDAQDALGAAEKQPEQLGYAFEVFQDQIKAENIVFAGMGGSAAAALVSQSWPGELVPFEVVRNYDIPAYVSPKTYFIAASYSGNTEETLEALTQAEAKGAQIAIITAGGTLADRAYEKNYPLALLPPTPQPRYTLGYSFAALLTLLEQAGLTEKEAVGELTSTAGFLRQATQGWLSTVPASRNLAKQLALESIGKSAVIYAGPKLWPAAYRWKIGFNETAKQVAWANQLPEFNHNELTGWSEQPIQKPYAVIDIRSNLEHERVQKRFEVSERLLSGRRPAPLVVEPQGESLLEQLLWTMLLGDYVTIYTALANGLNPTPLDLVTKFKKEMEKKHE
jgi:glucose/mannose-6-phosphate isomerase